jgi:hypothetical protein
MYTLNDIIKVLNKILDIERTNKGIKATGYFSSKEYIFVQEAEIVKCILILFNEIPFVRCQQAVPKKEEKEQVKKEKEIFWSLYQDTLSYLFQTVRFGVGDYSYDKLVDGTFNGTIIEEF